MPGSVTTKDFNFPSSEQLAEAPEEVEALLLTGDWNDRRQGPVERMVQGHACVGGYQPN